MLKLIYHPVSPFSRMVYMLAKERGLADKIELHKVVVCPIPYPGWSDNNAEVNLVNPLGKIPALVLEEGQALFDSRVICDYLESMSHSSWPIQNLWKLRSIHACALGIMDAEASAVYEEKIRGEKGIMLQSWFDGMRKKVVQGLDFLDLEVRNGSLKPSEHDASVNQADIAVAVALIMLDSRGLGWRSGRSGLEKYYDVTWKNRLSLVETDVMLDWKTGQPLEDQGFKAW